jgi:hypothetical protein
VLEETDVRRESSEFVRRIESVDVRLYSETTILGCEDVGFAMASVFPFRKRTQLV